MQRAWVRETAGWLGALALALIVSGQVAASARAELLFRDADSLIVPLFARALQEGTAADWAMSSVLFLPESLVFALVDAVLPIGVDGMLAVSAVLNLLALYGGVRWVAGRRRPGWAPIAWSVLAVAVFGVIAMTEASASRDALELASLLLTTTYYSATVVAVVLTIGLIRRHIDAERNGIARLVVLAAIAAVSTLSNPLYAAWATVPLTAILLTLSVTTRQTRLLIPLAVLLGATVVGFVARMPFAEWITNTGAGYAQPQLWRESLDYYAGLLGDRLATPLGVLGTLVTLALLILAAVRTVRADNPGERFVALTAWVIPVLVVVGAIALGTQAARYLQPLAFAPILVLVARPRALAPAARVQRQVVAVLAVLLVSGSALSIPRLASAATRPDPDLTCVTDWVEASGRTGAGQFWTVRLPKVHLADPAQLVQVDHQLRGYAWLIDWRDLDVGTVSFLIEDAQTVPWDLPVAAVPDEVIGCGRYRILDFGDQLLPLGMPHS